MNITKYYEKEDSNVNANKCLEMISKGPHHTDHIIARLHALE